MTLAFVIRDPVNDCIGLDVKPKIPEDLFPVKKKSERFGTHNFSEKSCAG